MNGGYKGEVKAGFFTGQAQLAVGDEGLLIDWLFDSRLIPYNHIQNITLENYTVKVTCRDETIEISKLGHSCDWFFKEFKAAYDSRVLAAVKVTDAPLLTCRGKYAWDDKTGDCQVQVFEKAFCILPQDENGRRVPFVFINGMKEENYSLIFSLTTGEVYRLFMMGRDFEPFARDVKKGIRSLQENNRTFVKELCQSLAGQSLEDGARLLPEGIAVPLERLRQRVPGLEAAIEGKIKNSKMQETYSALGELCGGSRFAAGIKKLPEDEFERLLDALRDGLEEEPTDEQIDALRWIIWAAVPSKDGTKAVVEFAFPGEAAATYIFRVSQPWESFLAVLNRAMEAVDLAREVISLSEQQLEDDEHADYQIAISRTPALKYLRSAYAGKVIHRSLESWKQGVTKLL